MRHHSAWYALAALLLLPAWASAARAHYTVTADFDTTGGALLVNGVPAGPGDWGRFRYGEVLELQARPRPGFELREWEFFSTSRRGRAPAVNVETCGTLAWLRVSADTTIRPVFRQIAPPWAMGCCGCGGCSGEYPPLTWTGMGWVRYGTREADPYRRTPGISYPTRDPAPMPHG